jgi:tetratricopeptide (TPR) repeat protein
MNSIGQRLREARLARGLTQQELAKGLATKGFISQVERDRAVPSLPKLRVMAGRLGVPLDYFTGDTSALELTYLRKSAELAVKVEEPERALTFVEEALPLVTTADERADLLRIRGTALDAMGRLNDALLAHQTAASVAPPDDPELNAAIYAEIATVLQQQEQFNAAIEANRRALIMLDRCRHADPALRSRVLHNLGRSSWGLGQVKPAHDYFSQALAAAMDAESVKRAANAHMSLSVSARAVGDLDRAIEHCRRALELHNRMGQARGANRVLNNLGDVYYAQGKKAEARATQLRCLEKARELKDDLEIGIAGGELARYTLESGDVREALMLARESRQAARRSGDHLHEAIAAALEARAADRLGQPQVANRKFKAAIAILLSRQSAAKVAEVCTMFADVLRERGRTESAFALMRIAAERDFSKLPALLKAIR